MLDFDNIDDWAPEFATMLRLLVPASVGQKLLAAAPQFTEDARELLFALTDCNAVIDTALEFIRSTTIAGYHGTRLTDAEVASVRSAGLIPLKAENRRHRLTRALSPHPRWREVAHRLDAALEAHGQGAFAGRREHQVHLTLSKSGLTNGFNHYLIHGAEFDQHVAHMLLGPEGKELLARDGKPRVIRAAVPGAFALDAVHPYCSINDLRARGDVPNLIDEFLRAWSYRLAHQYFQSRTLRVDCGMVFCSAVPAAWIIDIDTLSD